MSDISIELNFPYEHPNKNGFIYTKEAIKEAFSQDNLKYYPVRYQNEIIGYIENCPKEIEWDEAEGVCKIKLNGDIFYMMPSYIINKYNGNIISDFSITSIDIFK